MHLQGGARPRVDAREELGRLAAVAGAAGLAIAQPVLDAFGRSPETFIFRDATGTDVVAFALVVALFPPLVVWGAGVAVGWRAPRWRTLVHGASIGALVALAAVQALASAGRVAAVAGAAVIGMVAWVLTVRAAAFQLWSRLLAGLPVLALVAFLAMSPSSDLLAASDFDVVASTTDAAPVVLLVLDELPTASIIDADGRIDEVRFPNLARLAGQGTWYRNHTTVAGFTTDAVPAIFTGQLPDGDADPLFTDHPDSLFRLLAGSHDLVVSESLTRLCPSSVCGDGPTAPGRSPVQHGGAQLGALFGDAVELWWDRVGGGDPDPSADLGEFQEELVSADGAFDETTASESVSGWTEDLNATPERFAAFVDALEPVDRPIAAVLHLVSPHFPWVHLPDGTVYAAAAEGADLPINGGNGGVAWVANLERQRHLLQASYTDRLVGEVLDRIEQDGWYDEAAIVVTADHGVAFHGEENRRTPTEPALPEIMWSPLIVKAPGQTEARVDDSNVMTIDVLPTIADLIGVDLPWQVDGLAAGSDAQLARGSTKPFKRFFSGQDPYPIHDMEVDGEAGLAAVLDLAFPSVGPDDDPLAALHRLSGFGDLVGRPFAPDGDVPGSTFEVDDLDRLLRGSQQPFVITGTVDGGRVGEDAVAAIADGVVVAVSPVVFRNIGGPAFALLLPVDGSASLGELHLALVSDGALLDGGRVAAG